MTVICNLAAQALEELRDFLGWAFEGEVVGVPRLEDGGVSAAEVFSKGEEADPIEDHSPDTALHDTFAAEDDGGRGADGASQHQPAFVLVHVVGKPSTARPPMTYFPEEGVATQVLEAVIGVRKSKNGRVWGGLGGLLGVGAVGLWGVLPGGCGSILGLSEPCGVFDLPIIETEGVVVRGLQGGGMDCAFDPGL